MLAFSPQGFCGERPPIRVLIWDEQQPEQFQGYQGKFLGETIAEALRKPDGFTVMTVSLESPEQGCSEQTLDAADVVIWWAHRKSTALTNANAERVVARVLDGRLSLVALHSAHWSKPFVRLMQERAKADALAQLPAAERATAKWTYLNENPIYKVLKPNAPLSPALQKKGDLWELALPVCVFPTWRADGAPSRVTTLLPSHPIAKGLPAEWEITKTEMYSEPFHVPKPDSVVFEERWEKGEQFRSGCLWTIGGGRVFYFRPGHETYPVYLEDKPLRVIENAARWLGTK
jgi:trehalose utilization protein